MHFVIGVTKLNTQPIAQQNGISANQSGETTINAVIVEHASISMTENASSANTQLSEAGVPNGKDEPIPVDGQSTAVPESALQQLANQPEAISKYNDMTNDVKVMDMIAFKVFTPNFEQSSYVIGLVEEIIGRTTTEQQDYDLVIQIMGE